MHAFLPETRSVTGRGDLWPRGCPGAEERRVSAGTRTVGDPAWNPSAAAGPGSLRSNRGLRCVRESSAEGERTATSRASALKNQVWRPERGAGGGGNPSAPQSDKALLS